MMRSIVLFAVLAVAAAGRNKKAHKFSLPDPSQYTLYGDDASTPGGSFNVQGRVSMMNIIDETNPFLQYCPSDSLFLGTTRFMPQWDSYTVDWEILLLSNNKLKKHTGSSPFNVVQTDIGPLLAVGVDNNITFTIQAAGYSWLVNSQDDSATVTLLERAYGLGNCIQTMYMTQSINGAYYFIQERDAAIKGDLFGIAGFSDFTIQQTTQGGFRIDGAFNFLTNDVNGLNEQIDNYSVDTAKFGNVGSVCNFTNATTGGIYTDRARGRPKRGRVDSINASPRCPSFAAMAASFGEAGTDDILSATDIFDFVSSESTYYGFTVRQPYYNGQGIRTHANFSIFVTQLADEQDYWAVIIEQTENADGDFTDTASDITRIAYLDVFLAQRTGRVASQISAQHLKHKETMDKQLFKQSQQGKGYFTDLSGNQKNTARVGKSSFSNGFRAAKTRSVRKETKSKRCKTKRCKKARKERQQARRQGTVV